MTLDEMEKSIEFILQMQAKFESNLARSAENNDKLGTSVASLRVSVAELAGIVSESMRISDDRFTRLDERLAKLTEAQKRTDERLNALIDVVEGHITGHKHGPQTEGKQ
jgi:hypothetical protein